MIVAAVTLSCLPTPALATPSKDTAAKTTPTREAKPRLELFASPQLIDVLLPVTQQRYTTLPAIDALFARLQKDGDAYCERRWRLRKALPRPFIADKHRRKMIRGGRRSLPAMIAGCWNFFTMNDLRPDRGMKLVAKLFPKSQFDCMSVGLMQGYLMDQHLKCQRLSMLDIDWRILEAHRQLLGLFAKGALDGAPPPPRKRPHKLGAKPAPVQGKQLVDQLRALKLSWVQYNPPGKVKLPIPRRGVPGSLKLICSRRESRRCAAAIEAFQRRYTPARLVTLQLAGLHQLRYVTPEHDRVAVIFLSNAMDPQYHSWRDSKELRRRMREQMKPGQRAVIVHHVGGGYTFGLYQLKRSAKRLHITTLCKDPFERANRRQWIPYEIYLDKLSRNRNRKIPSCKKLLRRHRIP
ncbi:MAG: hypothetical protein CSA65_06575 [Proteobacteria bacterium]|nr:MAG: hypothetical protein CSA65_06575 [Pseudomonadota bacterium]